MRTGYPAKNDLISGTSPFRTRTYPPHLPDYQYFILLALPFFSPVWNFCLSNGGGKLFFGTSEKKTPAFLSTMQRLRELIEKQNQQKNKE